MKIMKQVVKIDNHGTVALKRKDRKTRNTFLKIRTNYINFPVRIPFLISEIKRETLMIHLELGSNKRETTSSPPELARRALESFHPLSIRFLVVDATLGSSSLVEKKNWQNLE